MHLKDAHLYALLITPVDMLITTRKGYHIVVTLLDEDRLPEGG